MADLTAEQLIEQQNAERALREKQFDTEVAERLVIQNRNNEQHEKSRKLDLLHRAQQQLEEAARAKPAAERAVPAASIIAYAKELEAYVNEISE